LGLVALQRPEETTKTTDAGAWCWRAQLPGPQRPAGRGLQLRHRARMAWLWGPQRLPLVAAKHWHPAMPALLRRACREFRPDAVLIELAQMAQYLPFLRSIPSVLTDHEAGTPANAQTNMGAWADRRDARLWRSYVDKHYRLAGLVQTVTEEDAVTLGGRIGRAVTARKPTVTVPSAPVNPDRAPPRALFLGSYSHAPNPEAARVLVRDVLPRLRKRIPEAELWFAGPNCEKIEDLGETEGVRVCGFAPDLAELYSQVRVMLAPLYSGGGFRMKSLSALAHGLPVVTNELGARGCDVPAPARVLAEPADELAAATAELMASSERVEQAGSAAYAWALDNLAPMAVAEAQIARIEQLIGC